jgi:endonuclease YncB( thermonuclease family)
LSLLKISIISSLMLVFSFPTLAETLSGRVVHIADGDTITVLDSGNHQHKIRLAGIDAPERKQAYGKVSGKHLADLVAGKAVSVEWSKHDKYQRIVGKVLLDSQDICLEQIKAGMAWHYKKYQGEQSPKDRVSYAAAEDEARAARRGLWKDANPVPPWEWRHNNKEVK